MDLTLLSLSIKVFEFEFESSSPPRSWSRLDSDALELALDVVWSCCGEQETACRETGRVGGKQVNMVLNVHGNNTAY